MEKIRKGLLMFVAIGCCLWGGTYAEAAYYQLGNQTIEMDGFFRQEFGYNVNDESPTNEDGLQSAYSMLLVEASAEFGSNWDARIITRLWADWIYSIKKDDDHFEKYFEAAREEHHFFDDFDDILREAYVTYASSKFLVRVGRQQIGWGESDGLRLMDVVNALDVRRGGPFYDTQGFSEARIPTWLLKAEYYPSSIGDITDITLQFLWNPGDLRENIHQQFPDLVDFHKRASGDATGLSRAGGPWAVPTAFGPPIPADITLIRRTDSIENSEFGARVSLAYKDVNMTFNFWHGFAHEPVTDYQKIDYHPDGALTPLAPVPLAIYHNLVYPRVTYAGYTCNFEAPIIGKMFFSDTNPVIRLEALYSFDEKIQTNEEVPNPAGGPPLDVDALRESDQLRYMLGFDWNVRWQWLNPEKSIFFSGQFFHEHAFDAANPGVSDIPDNSSYALWLQDRDEYYVSLLMATDYLNEKLSTNILYVEHLNTNARWCKATVGYKFGVHWRPSLTYLFIDGGYQQHGFSLYRDRDEISLRIQYLF